MFRGLWVAPLLRKHLRHCCWQGSTSSGFAQTVGVVSPLQLQVLWARGRRGPLASLN